MLAAQTWGDKSLSAWSRGAAFLSTPKSEERDAHLSTQQRCVWREVGAWTRAGENVCWRIRNEPAEPGKLILTVAPMGHQLIRFRGRRISMAVQLAQGPDILVEVCSVALPGGQSLSLALTAETVAKWLLLETSTATLNGSGAKRERHTPTAPFNPASVCRHDSAVWLVPHQLAGSGAADTDELWWNPPWKPLGPHMAGDILLDLLWSRMLS